MKGLSELRLNYIDNIDCLEGLKDIPTRSIDLIVTDPPYGILDFDWDKTVDATLLHSCFARILRRGGRLVIFCQEPYTSELVLNAAGDLRFNYKGAWIKDTPGNVKMAKSALCSVIEDILVFTKHGPSNENPCKTAATNFVNTVGFTDVAEALLESGKYKDLASAKKNLSKKIKIPGVEHDYCNYFTEEDLQLLSSKYTLGFSPEWYLSEASLQRLRDKPTFNLFRGEAMKTNAFFYKKPRPAVHPTQKPVELIQDLVRTYSNSGEVVLDPFMGSGTTAVACIRTGRNFIGFEMNPEYHATAQQRIADAVDELLAEEA